MRNPAVFVLSLILLAISSCGTGSDPYSDELQSERSQRDAFFKYGDDSPLPEEKRDDFTGLNYFNPDINFKVKAEVDKSSVPEDMEITISEGQTATFEGMATLHFELRGEHYSLKAYQPPAFLATLREGSILFVPFYDDTNEKSTYPQGRYIDIPDRNEQEIELDFNKAYQPFCRFDDRFVCPEPPEENRLSLPVEAGEKMNEKTN